jgi:acetyltransferase-like isoleucine patch superfamily enzyme
VTVGRFVTLAGVRSTLITHQIDLLTNRQTVAGIAIGDHALISSNCRIAPGARIAGRTMFAMGSVIAGDRAKPGFLHGGVPARPIKEFGVDAAHFVRTTGEVSPE